MDIMATLFDQENITRLYGLQERNEGRNEGRNARNAEFVRNLFKMNMDIPFIEKATGLSKDEILKLKEQEK